MKKIILKSTQNVYEFISLKAILNAFRHRYEIEFNDHDFDDFRQFLLYTNVELSLRTYISLFELGAAEKLLRSALTAFVTCRVEDAYYNPLMDWYTYGEKEHIIDSEYARFKFGMVLIAGRLYWADEVYKLLG